MRFLFDVHVHLSACHQLQRKGVDVVHAGEVGLGDAADHELLAFAIREDRIVVTRNYHDFARLAEAFAGQGRPFPGILFLPTSLASSDTGGHVRALERWIQQAPTDKNPIANTYAWLG